MQTKARYIGIENQSKAPSEGKAKHLGKSGQGTFARQSKAPRQGNARHLGEARARHLGMARQGTEARQSS
jgi:hypothetical protein